MSTDNILTNSDPPSASASRSPSPEITVAPPSPREESNSSNEFSIEQQPAGTPSKDGESQRRHTNMGLPGHDFTYFLLSEEVILTELSRLSAPKIINNGALHTASLQPHPAKHSQDRLVAEQWDLGERGSWKFRAVFDGHANGDETVDHVFTTLPSKIRSSLTTLSIPHCTNVEAVSSLLQETISAIDNSIKQGVLDLFPSSDYIDQLSDDEIRAIVNDQSTVLPSKIGLPTLANKYAGRGPNNIKVTRAMRGTTVLVVLINSDGGLWTASLGDCQAVLGQKESSFWTTTILSTNHNASEPSEVARLKLDHPGEEESAVAKNRVLGLIAVTRAIGDHQFKLPSIYTKRVFSLTIPGMNRPDHTQIIVKRNLTPPYVSGIPEVKYVKLHDGARGLSHPQVFPEATHIDTNSWKEACLFMCSDGLLDLYGGENWQEKHIDIAELCKTWVDLVGEKLDSSSQSFDPKENLALFLLNRGLRGPPRSYTGEIWSEEEALNRVSSLLTLEFKDKWMDDTTVLVEIL
ncbi:protein serine threonine phosphatase 2C [Lentinula edodes]|uniref:phosphatase 2C-like domain-containing protein n=1 Tax=Lentinula edodes TaxID=5353 RepID=UPI001E8D5413|nr:phosphatase 2C-like domain-containing protein [Lentinula edodes]KAH7881550.1 phosphatase 2C-like domain-containing protein [Lentinula edodes]KAJ3903673.1 protein serine threonine phosphatase 2C [Lentinula edodes]